VSKDYTPHACFRFTSASPATEDADLRAALTFNLRKEFDSLRTIDVRWLATLTMVLPGARDSWVAVLGRSQFEPGEWILIVRPPSTQSWLDRLRGRRPESNAELALTCRKLHTILAGLTGVGALRWYFEGPRSQSEAALAGPRGRATGPSALQAGTGDDPRVE
jgi:hypothetical protein